MNSSFQKICVLSVLSVLSASSWAGSVNCSSANGKKDATCTIVVVTTAPDQQPTSNLLRSCTKYYYDKDNNNIGSVPVNDKSTVNGYLVAEADDCNNTVMPVRKLAAAATGGALLWCDVVGGCTSTVLASGGVPTAWPNLQTATCQDGTLAGLAEAVYNSCTDIPKCKSFSGSMMNNKSTMVSYSVSSSLNCDANKDTLVCNRGYWENNGSSVSALGGVPSGNASCQTLSCPCGSVLNTNTASCDTIDKTYYNVSSVNVGTCVHSGGDTKVCDPSAASAKTVNVADKVEVVASLKSNLGSCDNVAFTFYVDGVASGSTADLKGGYTSSTISLGNFKAGPHVVTVGAKRSSTVLPGCTVIPPALPLTTLSTWKASVTYKANGVCK